MFRNKMLHICLFSFAILFNFTSAFAEIKCDDLFQSSPPTTFFYQIKKNSTALLSKFKNLRAQEFPLTEVEQAALLSLVSSNSTFKKLDYVMAGKNSNNPVLWFVWKKLANEQQGAFLKLMSFAVGNEIQARRVIEKTLSKMTDHPFNSKLYFDVMVSTWLSESRLRPVAFAEWVQGNLESYDKNVVENSNFLLAVEQKYEWGVLATAAKSFWSEQAGVQELPVVQNENKQYVQMLDQLFPVQINQITNSVQIRVPKSQVKIAAWNPIYTEVLLKKIAEGGSPLKKYPGFLGADGYFYLSDGNHRFTLDQREFALVEMSYPAKSSSLSITFDAMGIKQPTVEQLMRLLKKEISLSEVMVGRSPDEIKFK